MIGNNSNKLIYSYTLKRRDSIKYRNKKEYIKSGKIKTSTETCTGIFQYTLIFNQKLSKLKFIK